MESMIGVVACAMVFGLLLGALIGAVILRAACALYNKLAGANVPPSRLPRRDVRWEGENVTGTGITDEPRPGFASDYGDEPAYEDISQPRGVPEPSLGKAMGIVIVTTIINAMVSFFIGLVIGGVGATAGVNPRVNALFANVVALPVSILVMGGMCAVMLPTTFGKGLLVALLYLLITFAIAIVIGGIFLVIALALGGLKM